MGQHWYNQKGDSAYEVVGKNGKLRDTTLRDARKLKLVPSVTTVTSVKASPGLQVYFRSQLLNAVQKTPPEEPLNEWRRKVAAMAGQHAKNAAERGNEIHDMLEGYFNNGEIGVVDRLDREICEAALALIHEKFPGVTWEAEASFCDLKFGFGGRVDLHSKDGDGIILDFKTKDGDDVSKFKAYADHHMQSAAYAVGLEIPRAKRYNLFISRDTPGVVKLTESEDFDKDWRMFEHLLEYWKLANNYNPGED